MIIHNRNSNFSLYMIPRRRPLTFFGCWAYNTLRSRRRLHRTLLKIFDKKKKNTTKQNNRLTTHNNLSYRPEGVGGVGEGVRTVRARVRRLLFCVREARKCMKNIRGKIHKLRSVV